LTRVMQETETKKRAREVYRLRVEENLTLQQIGDRMGLSRERIRQIEAKYKQFYLRQDLFASGKIRIVVMGDLRALVPARVWQMIRAADLESYPVQSFLDRIDLREALDFPNVGKNTVHELLHTLEKAGYDVSHLWAARNWQNYDPSDNRGSSFARRDSSQLYRLPSLYTESGPRGQGAGLPTL